MFAVRCSINQSRPHRVRAKTLGMCVKGTTGPPASVNAGLFQFSLPFNDIDLTNSTAQSISTLAGTPPLHTSKPCNPHNLSFSQPFGLSNIAEHNYSISGKYEMVNNSVLLGEGTQHARYLQHGIYYNGTDPTNDDTDQDGLLDGDELGTSKTIDTNGDSETLILDPTNPDYDGDGLQDGQEVNGYDATYFERVGDDNEERSIQINDADPFAAYKLEDGTWLDTDGDGIYDIAEQDPKNESDRFDKTSRFYTVYGDGEETDKQFNQFTVEPFKPGLDYLSIDTYGSDGAYATIELHVNDTAGIDYVYLKNKDNQKSIKLFLSDAVPLSTDGIYEFSTDLDIQYWNDYIYDGWDLKVKIVDINGNTFEKEKHIKSEFGQALNLMGLGWIGEMLQDAWEDAKGLASAFLDWLKDQVGWMFSKVFNPIIEGLKNWAEGIKDAMIEFFDELVKWNEVDGDESVDATMTAGTALMLSLIGQQDKAEEIMDVMQKVMNFIKPYQKYISPFGLVGVLGNLLGTQVPAIGNFFNTLKDAGGKAMGWIINRIFGKENSLFSLLGLTDKKIDSSGFPDLTLEGIRNFVNNCDLLKNNPLVTMTLDAIGDVIKNYESTSSNGNSICSLEGYSLLVTWCALWFGIGMMAKGLVGVLGGESGYGSLLIESIVFLFTEISLMGGEGALLFSGAGTWITLLFGSVATITTQDPYTKGAALIEIILASAGFSLSVV
ncbi:MAG: hypothetical protein R6U61_08715 [Thermoplasmata archaeon]